MFVAFLAAASITGAAPNPPTDGAVTAANAQAPAKEKKICRREVATGSKFGKRVCMTEAEHKQRAEDSQRMLDEMQRAGHTNNTPSGN